VTSTRLWLGTYPPTGPDGAPDAGEAVWALDLDTVTGGLRGAPAATAAAPSFVVATPDGRTVFAAGETSPGVVTRFEVGTTLVRREQVASGGASPCHLLLDPAGRALYVSNYGSGTIAVVPLLADARFAGGVAQVFDHSGSGPRADRQEGPHAHSTLLAPGGRHLLALDLGTDEIRRYRIDADGRLAADGVAIRMRPGTGPRHAAVSGDHLYVVGELTSTVHVLAWDAETATAREVQVVPACASPLATGNHLYPAHVVVTGDRVLVSVRGADVIASFAIHDGGSRLEHVVDVGVGGGWPRHFAVVGEWVVVAVQNGGQVVSLPISDLRRTTPAGLREVGTVPPERMLEVPYPACVEVHLGPGAARRRTGG
jgi:6-phosphogluconolactonase (cycloisomerase 2 family)